MTDSQPVVLVVDDSPANIHLLSGILKSRYKVKAATNGEKALQIARKDPPPDMILLDVMMPEMDGYEVCRRLKADPQTSGIPIIFVSGHIDEEERKKGPGLGAVAYLIKPIDPPALLHQIQALL
jgi:putative two-component system response regulator